MDEKSFEQFKSTEEYIKKEDVLKILYGTKENKDISENNDRLIDIIQQIRNLSPEKVISEDMGKCELAIAQNNNLHTDCNYCIELAKIEAVEELSKRLKELKFKVSYCGSVYDVVDIEDIDNFVKKNKGEE